MIAAAFHAEFEGSTDVVDVHESLEVVLEEHGLAAAPAQEERYTSAVARFRT